MKSFVTYDPATGLLTGHLKARPDMVRDMAHVAEVSAGFDPEHLDAWKYDIDSGELVAVDRVIPGEEVNEERDRRLAAGATVSVTGYGDIPVQGRERDQINLIALGATAKDLAAAGVTDPVLPFRDATNAMHMLTPEQMAEMVRKGKAAASALYAAAWALKDADPTPQDYADDHHWP